MGHRANLVVVDDKQYHLYYCHWCAITITRDVFWGPNWALAFIGQQHLEEIERGWLDNVWAEGGVLVDIHQKHLLLWGGDTLHYQIPLRRLYLDLLQEVWQGWTIRWAYHEIYDLAAYVGLDREAVTTPVEIDPFPITIYPLLPDEIDMVASIAWEDGRLQFVPMGGGIGSDLTPALLEEATRIPFQDTLNLQEPGADFPTLGVHIEVARRSVWLWAASAPDLPKLREVWAGWEIQWLEDDYEYQVTQTKNRLVMPLQDDDVLLHRLETMLLSPQTNVGIDMMKRLVERFGQEEKEVQVNPYAMEENLQTTPDELRRTIFDQAVAAWRHKRTAL